MGRALLTATIACALAFAAIAHGELTQQRNLRLSFNGKIEPKKLPRETTAPVTLRLRGAIGTADGNRPPQLRKMAIAFNRYGRVSTRGLPVCKAPELEQTTSKTALERCRGALVGHGRFKAYVDLEGRRPVPVEGASLAFNSSTDGKPGLLLHIYGKVPVQITFVLKFRILRLNRPGTYGTIFVARIPKIASTLGYVTDIDLTFGRRYTYQGRQRSFLSARCAAPAGFPGAVFTLAKGSFTFDNGQRISSALSRNCWVR
jgi:hypothetical protein